MRQLGPARATLEEHGDRSNAAHAGYLEARRALLIGQLQEATDILDALDVGALPPASRTGFWLVTAGIAMRRIRAGPARKALTKAEHAARDTGIPALAAEVDRALRMFNAPIARLIMHDGERLLDLAAVESLFASATLVIDACRNAVRVGDTVISLRTRPVLLTLARVLAEVWPKDATREALLARAFGARDADESHRARLRVEIGRLRKTVKLLAGLTATSRGYRLKPRPAQQVAVLAPPAEGDHAEIMALLSDGEAWSSSALALALGISPRTVQRALEALAQGGKVETFGRGRACRWIASGMPGFPTSLLLPAVPETGKVRA